MSGLLTILAWAVLAAGVILEVYLVSDGVGILTAGLVWVVVAVVAVALWWLSERHDDE